MLSPESVSQGAGCRGGTSQPSSFSCENLLLPLHKLTCCLQVPPPLTPREVTPGSEKCLSFWGEAGEDAPAAAGGRGACGEGCPDWLSLQGSQQHASCHQCPATAAPRQAGQGQVPNLPHWRPALATSRPVPRLSTFLRVFLPQNPAPD